MPCDQQNIYSKTSGGTIVLASGEVMLAEKLERSRKAYRPHWATCSAREMFKNPPKVEGQ